MSVLIIAEAGVNHNGSLSTAKKLVDVAVEAGADVVKFQTFQSNLLATGYAPKAKYQEAQTVSSNTQLMMLQELELSRHMHHELIEYCAEKDIGFLSTAFDLKSLEFLLSLKPFFCKVPSGEITNLPYLRVVADSSARVILSTGMASMHEIERAVTVLTSRALTKDDLTILHCNTEYPTPMSDVNLRAMETIRDAFGCEVGYSDHTLGIEISIAAVALGATVIEKHITLDRHADGPDHKASIEPAELTQLVRSIRNVESSFGSGVKEPSDSESKNIVVARKSIVASRSIRAGESFSAENITTKRPGNGISPMEWDAVVGKTASRDFSYDEFIEL